MVYNAAVCFIFYSIKSIYFASFYDAWTFWHLFFVCFYIQCINTKIKNGKLNMYALSENQLKTMIYISKPTHSEWEKKEKKNIEWKRKWNEMKYEIISSTKRRWFKWIKLWTWAFVLLIQSYASKNRAKMMMMMKKKSDLFSFYNIYGKERIFCYGPLLTHIVTDNIFLIDLICLFSLFSPIPLKILYNYCNHENSRWYCYYVESRKINFIVYFE